MDAVRSQIVTVKSFTAKVERGSAVKFTWVIDDLEKFTHEGESYTVMFRKPSEHKLKVIASNPVSSQSEQILLCADDVTPMADPEFLLTTGCQLQWLTSPSSLLSRAENTQRCLVFGDEVTKGSNVTYRWLAIQSKNHLEITGEGDIFQISAETPGKISVQVTASNFLGEASKSFFLEGVERLKGALITSQSDVVALGETVNISVSVTAGSHLRYFWHVKPNHPPVETNVSFLLQTFSTVGHSSVNVSVLNVISQSNVTKDFTVQEKVQEVDFEIDGGTRPFYVPTKNAVTLHGLSQKGSNLHWSWKIGGATVAFFNQQTSIYSFLHAGIYQVSLNISNRVSWMAVSHNVTVQDPIKQLVLKVSKSSSCSGEEVTFVAAISSGSNASFAITFRKGDWVYSQNIPGGRFTTSSLPAGTLLVTVKAWNWVSSAEASSSILVIDGIQGLRIVNCCSGSLEAEKASFFKSEIQSRDPVNYTWRFHLVGFEPLWFTGQEVVFSPPGSGFLLISVLATDGVCSKSVNGTATVQWPVNNLSLVCHSDRIFAGHAARFSADAFNGTNVSFLWDFGDSTDPLATDSDKVSYTYHTPGKYNIVIIAFNNVSRITAHLYVEVEILQCSSPQVSLVHSCSTIIRSRSNYFEASVVSNCSAYNIRYQWEVLTLSATYPEIMLSDNKARLGGQEAASLLLLIPKHSLSVGQYCLLFTVSLQGTPLQVQQNTTITVVNAPLVAVIKGGSKRLWPHLSDLTLDGSESQDLDREQGEEDMLKYDWSFVALSVTPSQSSSVDSVNNVTVKRRTLTVKNLMREDAASQWLMNKSQTELRAVVQHGNPQEIIPYAIALTSRLNQAVPSELTCEDCQKKVLETAGKLIHVLEEQASPGVLSAVKTGVALSAVDLAGILMRSVMRLRGPQQAPVLLSAPHINTVGFRGDPAHLLCTNHLQSSTSVPCQFYIPPYFTAHLKSQKSEVVQVLLDTDSKLVSNPLATAADPPISTTLVAMELSTPQGKPIAVQHLDPEQAIRVTLPKKGPAGQDSGSTEWKEGKTGNETCLTVSLPTEGSLNFTIAAVGRHVENTGLYISFNFSLDAGLDPSWYVQHVVVWDAQTDHMFFFLLEDWLSVDNHKNSTVEKEVLASCPDELSQFRRVFASQLLFGVFEHHLWVSLWEHPAISCFTRSQRVTCSALVLHLYLALGALWYGAVGTELQGEPVSAHVPFDLETVAVGMVVAILVFPIQSFLCFLFRKTQSQLLESKMFDSSILEFWAASGLAPQTDGVCREEGIHTWPSYDSLLNIPAGEEFTDATRDPKNCKSLPFAGQIRQLRRKKPLTQLRLAPPLSTNIQIPLDQKVSPRRANLPKASDHKLATTLTSSGVPRGQPTWLLPSWALRVIYPVVGVSLAACLVVVVLYGSLWPRNVVLLWLISTISAFLTSALLLEPLKICMQAFICTTIWRPVDPEVEDHLALETTVVTTSGEHSRRVRPPYGYGLLRAKQEARKARTLRSHMKLQNQGESFIDFHRAACLAQGCSQSGAILLTVLILKDYELVEFFIKRVKLWLGLTKAKEVGRGVVRLSQESHFSTLSSSLSPSRSSSSSSPWRPSTALSVRSDDQSVSDSGLDTQLHLDRLLPCVNALLGRFDQVNQVTEDIYNLEMKLEEALARRRKKLSNKEISIRGKPKCSSKPIELGGEEPENKKIRSRKIGVIYPKSRVPLSSSFSFTPSSLHGPTPPMSLFPRNCSRYSESNSVPFQRQASSSIPASEAVQLAPGTFDLYPAGSLVVSRSPRRRAWHSGSSHSADAVQRSFLSQDGLRKESYALTSAKPLDEEVERGHMSDGVPVKRKAWT
ncbi:unnamed protein product [Tetraodon nigroviridis]|uniref:(spotted green pufferfish) hypothetical protein n=1 Tax=Tetraodon nigroviridis TaxID=99883 RepID=Q4T3T9_TETNG|nr:unnamed protein product [Tetraodon nigroviridis]